MALFSRITAFREPASPAGEAEPRVMRLAYDPAAFDGRGPAEGLKAQFPQVLFEPSSDPGFLQALTRFDLVITAVDAAKPKEVDALCAGLRESDRRGRVIVFLKHPDVETTRRIVREGAGDVLLAPISEPALAATLERILAGAGHKISPGQGGQVVAMLKAGGGVGATAIASQLAALVADNGHGHKVCLVDLDLQFGMAALYLDVRDAITMGEVLAAGGRPSEVGFAAKLGHHPSGARVLGAPAAFMPLEAISVDLIDGLVAALKRDFDLVILDLPSAWTPWTARALRLADQVVMITNLSVPHAYVVQRQLGLLREDGLDRRPITLVCNRYGGDAPASISLRAFESAIGQACDVRIPEDRKLMGEAVNQGASITSIRRGSKLEKALRQLISAIGAVRTAGAAVAGG